MTDLDSANLCAKIYAVDAATDKFWSNYWEVNEIVCAHAVIDGVSVIVFRGSITPEDWMRDLDAIPMWTSKLGFVHAGFYEGLETLYPLIEAVVGNQVIITGHSLGAARACLTAGLFAHDASANAIPCPVVTLCTFGQPKPAFANLGRIIAKSGMEHRSYRNLNDPIPLVPMEIFPFINYQNTEPWVALSAEPAANDLGPLRDHHIDLYVQGIQSLKQ
jgi:hypothetical protein